MRKGLLAWVAAIALAPLAAPAVVPNPTVSVPPAGLKGHPLWDSWFEVGSLGYTEAEFFISGTARPNPASGVTTNAAYTTRIIVTRPIDPADFNGTVMMDWVNVTAQFENAVDTVESHDYLIREGYAFVHVSAQSAGICCTPLTPQVWDPVRYGAPGTTNLLNHPGDSYALDIFAQVAQALKSPTGLDPMGGLDVQRIIASGQSQSAGKLDDYLHQMQNGLGERVIDAFLIHGRVANRSAELSARANATTTRVLQLNSDFEAYQNSPAANPYFAVWDVAGAAHSSFWIGVHSEFGQGPRFAGGPQLPATADDDLHVGDSPYIGYATWNYGEQINPGQPVCILQGNQFPMHYAVNAAFDAIRRWLIDGVQPRSGPRFQFSGGVLARDADGNALGGIRLAAIEHPVASYRSADCALGGTTVPFTEAQLLTLYPTHAFYACEMRETTYQNVKDGWLLEEDALSLVSRVDGAANRWAPVFAGIPDCDGDTIDDAVDNCPLVANKNQLDSGGVNTHTADGIGDACQCGDVTGNGVVNGQDANAIKRHGLGGKPNPTFVESGNCDVTGNGSCNGQDANAVRIVALGRPFPLFGQNCQNADPFAPECTNCQSEGSGTTFSIQDGPNEQEQTLYAFFSAVSGDTIEFGPGVFEYDTTLVMAGNTGSPKDGVTILGRRGPAQRRTRAHARREPGRDQRAAPAALQRVHRHGPERQREHPGVGAGPTRADRPREDQQGAAHARVDRDELRALPQPRWARAEQGRVLRHVPARESQLRDLQVADHRGQLVRRPQLRHRAGLRERLDRLVPRALDRRERAIDEVASRIQSLIAGRGPRSVALYVGTYSGPHPATIPFAIGWLFAAGSRMVFTAATIDQPGKNVANALHGRWLGGSHVFDESDAWVLVGNNPLISMSGGIPPANPARRLREAKARGLALVVIDPRRTEVARFADVYLQPRPGEDPALLAALLHVVIREGLVDRDFVRDHVSGFAELEAAVAPFTPRFAAERAGVAAEEIERAAHAFGGARRGCGVAGTGPNMAPHGNLTEYLLLCLNTVCGRWRLAGERVANPGALLPKAVPAAQAQAPRRAFGFGEKLRVRGLASSAAGLPTAALADEILEPGPGQIRALICVGSNPIAAWPDQHKTRRAMETLELLVTLDMKLSATSRLAHYVIAPKLSLEVPGLSLSMEALEQTYVAMGYSEPYAQYSPAIAAPPPGADVIEEWEFFYGLAQRMGLPLSLYRRVPRRACCASVPRRPSWTPASQAQRKRLGDQLRLERRHRGHGGQCRVRGHQRGDPRLLALARARVGPRRDPRQHDPPDRGVAEPRGLDRREPKARGDAGARDPAGPLRRLRRGHRARCGISRER